jgi:hypothetical protein
MGSEVETLTLRRTLIRHRRSKLPRETVSISTEK